MMEQCFGGTENWLRDRRDIYCVFFFPVTVSVWPRTFIFTFLFFLCIFTSACFWTKAKAAELVPRKRNFTLLLFYLFIFFFTCGTFVIRSIFFAFLKIKIILKISPSPLLTVCHISFI
ncbi:hypothetical protein, unlikely [Trypanosoma brucei gambiense DAL972]|uniref:Uncharacterized protein n=1 Tax=Trypanosoma brucei gambiense (strain MHOM/CI/86/DAL972) TaxID=679716 RepID=C9ZP56_TRYB9|nr:hypothetical protein, unlikely [Trypanosoma brucei gambiense DAL972]CBH11184.1 hypothetical protein, unlikely [Trypanosoma brucei gambiense DAL972]|eukprot:XP_011773471.1 hypothetical protein, unlikely [Trypanosoma brucei gambiense DAL972]